MVIARRQPCSFGQTKHLANFVWRRKRERADRRRKTEIECLSASASSFKGTGPPLMDDPEKFEGCNCS